MIAAPHVNQSHDSSLEWGTVGWSDGQHYELGDGSGTDQAIALVHVTLFRGRDPSQPLDNTKAQGKEILCQLGGNFFCIPPLGCNVLVGTPHAFGNQAATSTILQARDERGSQFYGQINPGELCVGGLVGKGRMFFRNDDSFQVLTIDGAGANVTIYGGTDKIQIQNSSGTFTLQSNSAAIASPAVSLGQSPTDHVVCAELLLTQLNALITWAGAVSGALTSAGFPIIGPTATLVAALGQPNGSTTVTCSP